jgi:hypothetical protein
MALVAAKKNAPPVKDMALSLALLCTADNRPFNMVESVPFKAFVAELRPDLLPLPSGDTVKRRAVELDDVAHKEVIKYVTAETGYSVDDDGNIVGEEGEWALFSLTTDGGTSGSGDPLLAVTVHIIAKDFAMFSTPIALRHFPAPHTSENYLDLLLAIVEEMHLPRECLLCVTSDSENKMLLVAALGDYINPRCGAHGVHNAVRDLMRDLEPVMDPVIALAKFFSNIRVQNNQIATAAAKAMDVQLVRPALPNDTRWTSEHDTLDAHVKRWPVVKTLKSNDLKLKGADVAAYTKAHSTCATNEKVIEGVLHMLGPLKEASTRLQASDTPTLSLLFHSYKSIMSELEPKPALDIAAVATLRVKLRGYFDARWDGIIVPRKKPVPGGGPRSTPCSTSLSTPRRHWIHGQPSATGPRLQRISTSSSISSTRVTACTARLPWLMAQLHQVRVMMRWPTTTRVRRPSPRCWPRPSPVSQTLRRPRRSSWATWPLSRRTSAPCLRRRA